MFVVTLPADRAHDAPAYAELAHKAGANLLEIRGDLTPGLPSFEAGLPLLISPRGGDVSDLLNGAPAFVDLEWNEEGEEPGDGVLLIRSFHDYEETPGFDKLLPIVASMFAGSPRVACLKVATRIRKAEDLLVLRRIQDTFAPTIPITVLGMGELGWPNRVLSPWFNPLSYVALDDDGRAAPGQLLLKDSVSLFDAPPPRLYAVLGGENLKSLSPKIHNGLFAKHHADAFYGAWPTANVVDDFRALSAYGLAGFSVTAPHKMTMRQEMDHIDESAAHLPAVNTCVRHGDAWVGYQTDAQGIVRGYPGLAGDGTVAIVGSGGVVPSVIDACRQLGRRRIKLFARNAAAREELARRYGVEAGGLDELHSESSSLLIWTLPIDTDDILLPSPSPGAVALDLRYGRQTAFLERTADLGYRVHDGLNMLIHQALAQHELFCGREANEHDQRFLIELMKPHVQ